MNDLYRGSSCHIAWFSGRSSVIKVKKPIIVLIRAIRKAFKTNSAAKHRCRKQFREGVLIYIFALLQIELKY